MARRKIREKNSKFYGTKNVLKDMNSVAHSVLHDEDPTSTNAVSGSALVLGTPVYSGALAAGTYDDYTQTGLSTTSLLQILPNAGITTLAGIAGGVGGRVLVLFNVSTASNMLIAHEAGTSAAANRISCPGAVNVTLQRYGAVMLIYDATTSSRWRVVSP